MTLCVKNSKPCLNGWKPSSYRVFKLEDFFFKASQQCLHPHQMHFCDSFVSKTQNPVLIMESPPDIVLIAMIFLQNLLAAPRAPHLRLTRILLVPHPHLPAPQLHIFVTLYVQNSKPHLYT